jgi:hypothetical protein
MDELLGPISDDGLFAADDAAPDESVVPDADNTGRPVFCVPVSRVVPGFVAGSIVGGAVAVALHFALPAAAGMFALAALVGAGAGKRARHFVCSDADCNAAIPADARTCPGCGGVVAGHIKSRDQRLRAEEEWRASQRTRG